MRNDFAQTQLVRAGELVTLASWIARHGRGQPARTARQAEPTTLPTALELELELDRERERRHTFVSTLAHELRQPLSTLSTALEIVRLAPNQVATARAIEIMERQLRHMNRAVEDILDETRWARGKMALCKERLDLRTVVRDAVRDVAADAAARGHALIVTVAQEPLYVDADPQRLHQVLSNLLGNAVKYTEPGGCISLDAEITAATVTVRVADTGRGIAAASLPHIFELFSQVRPSEGAGVGIGLSVAREVVLLHNGRIDARSAGVGRGSEFIVTLPVASSNAFLIDVLAPLVWNQPPAAITPIAGVEDADDHDRMDDDGGSQPACAPGCAHPPARAH
jgi:signal transduction histidine kinase